MTQLVRTQSELPLNMFKSFFQKNRKLASGLFVVVLLFIAFTPVPTQAAGFCKTPIIGAGVCGLVLVPMQISAMILYIAGILFDFAIKFTIVDITKNLSNITGINIAWAVIRDLVNISFIFILLYTAIQAILNNTTGQIKQIIVGVVIAAVLINFSLFFTKIIIDGSNLVTLTFQKSMTANCEGKLSFCVMQNLGLPTTYKAEGGLVQTVDGYNDKVLDGVGNEIWKTIILSFGSSIFFLITAFIFLAASVMFVIRFVTIVFLLIFSPLAVIGSILPKLSQKKDEWWSTLTEQAIFPALFMLLMWVVLTILGSPGFITREGSISGALIGGAKIDSPEGLNNLSMVFNFAIIIAFMIGVLTISKGYSKRGGEMGGKFAGAIMGGTSGYVGRRTLGSASRFVADSEKLKRIASDKNSGLAGTMSRLALRTGQAGAGKTFDMRGIPGLPKDLGAGKASGKGGFDAYIKEKAKKEKDFADSLKPSDIKVDQAKQELEQAKKALKENDTPENRRAVYLAQEKLDALQGNKKDTESQVKDLAEEEKEKIKNLNEASNKSKEEAKKTSNEVKEMKVAEEELEKAREEERSAKDVFRQIEIEAEAAEEKDRAEKIKQREIARQKLEETRVATNDAREKLKTTATAFEGKSKEIDAAAEEARKAQEAEIKAKYASIKGNIEGREIKSAADTRKGNYAEIITKAETVDVLGVEMPIPSSNRVGLFGKIKRSNIQAAADIRKDKKSVEDRIKDILKDEGGEKKKEGEEEKKPEESGDSKPKA